MEMHEIKVMEVVPRSCAHCIASGSQRGEGRAGERKGRSYQTIMTPDGLWAPSYFSSSSSFGVQDISLLFGCDIKTNVYG